jgi:hypothetical protein
MLTEQEGLNPDYKQRLFAGGDDVSKTICFIKKYQQAANHAFKMAGSGTIYTQKSKR